MERSKPDAAQEVGRGFWTLFLKLIYFFHSLWFLDLYHMIWPEVLCLF